MGTFALCINYIYIYIYIYITEWKIYTCRYWKYWYIIIGQKCPFILYIELHHNYEALKLVIDPHIRAKTERAGVSVTVVNFMGSC